MPNDAPRGDMGRQERQMPPPNWQHLAPYAAARRDFARQAAYADLLASPCPAPHATDPNRPLLAEIISSRRNDDGCLPGHLGLGNLHFAAMCAAFFPEVSGLPHLPDAASWENIPEADDLCQLLLQTRAGQRESELWLVEIVVAACAGRDHLWQDLGLFSRRRLSQLMQINFPALAALNTGDMKWKKFIYKQLCSREGIYVCPAPSCSVCADFAHCFAPED